MNTYKLVTKTNREYFLRSKMNVYEVYRKLQDKGWVKCSTTLTRFGELALVKRNSVIAVEEFKNGEF